MNSLTHRQIEHRHGSLMALSHAFHRKIDLSRKTGNFDEKFISEWVELKKVITLLVEHLSDQQSLLVSAAINGISLIGSVVKLPFNDSSDAATSSTQDTDDKMEVDDEHEYSKEHIWDKILFLLKSAHSRPKIREEAAYCLGNLAIGDGAYFTQKNLNAFSNLIKLTKDATLNIAMAQSIVSSVMGYEIDENNVNTEKPINPYCDDKCFDEFLCKVIKMVYDPNPASRHTTGIWLLAFVKNCSTRAPIYKRKDILQYAFTELLSDDSGKRFL